MAVQEHKIIPNMKKTKTAMVFGSRPAIKKANKLEINLNNKMLQKVTTFDYLGVRTSNVLSWEPHDSRL